MNFNPSKCQVLHVTRLKQQIPSKYFLYGIELESVHAAKYRMTSAGVLILIILLKKANQTLVFLKRNIKVHNQSLKSIAYKTLLRPQFEYTSTVWSQHLATDIYKMVSVHRRAAIWVIHDYRYTSSVSSMLNNFQWRPPDQRCIDSCLNMMYKVTYNLVAIPAAEHLIPNIRRNSRHNHPLA